VIDGANKFRPIEPIFSAQIRRKLSLGSPQHRIGNSTTAAPVHIANSIEIASQRLESIPLAVNFCGSAKTHSTKDGERRTPALYGMLQQKRPNNRWQRKPTATNRGAQPRTDKYGTRGIRFQNSLDIPFRIELIEPTLNCRRPSMSQPRDALFCLSPNAFIRRH